MTIELPEVIPSTDQVTLKLYDLGGSGPPLLMAHATGFCGPMWAPMAETLRQRYRCVAFDFRAHGASSRPVGRELVWDGMADDVLKVVDAVGEAFDFDEPMPAVGHSMGGAALILAEARRPGSLSKIWAFEPILFGDPIVDASGRQKPIPNMMSQAARRRRPSFDSREEAYERYGSRPPLSGLDERALRAYIDHGFVVVGEGPEVALACRPADEAAVFEYHEAGAIEALAKLTVPCIAIVGEPSPPVDGVRAAAAENPGLEVASLPHLTHFGPFSAPEEVGEQALRWLQTIEVA